MSTVLEAGRSAAEELERIEQAITDRIIFNPHLLPETHQLSVGSVLNGKRKRPIRYTLLQQHEISSLLDRYTEQCHYLDQMLNVKPGSVEVSKEPAHPAILRKADIANIEAIKGTATEELFDSFYSHVQKAKEYHQRYPDDPLDDLSRAFKMKRTLINDYREQTGGEVPEYAQSLSDADKLLSSFTANIQIDTLFSGEEYFGRFVDLNEFHERFINLVFVVNKALSYLEYLDIFYSFENREIFAPKRLSDPKYFEYIAELDRYLADFLRKTRILARPESILAKIDQDFDRLYKSQKIPWLQKSSSGRGDDVDNNNPLFCKPCNKLFASEGVFKGHLNGKQHKRNVSNQNETQNETQNQNGNSAATAAVDKHRLVILHEYRVKEIASFIERTVKETRNNIERRQTLTDKERLEEAIMLEREAMGDGENIDDDNDDYDIEVDSDEERDSGATYNPLKLPIGWDGKPIPYWLWKLQGLGIEHICEICGNHSYMGRKVFESHFMDARHVYGLKCLGIDPSSLFKGITSITEAQALWEKIKKQNRSKHNNIENAIEVEDDEGNVMSQKVYNDLKKQGLI